MALDFSDATLLSYSQENQKFGENGLTFKNKKVVGVTGLLLDLNNSNGVKGNIEASEEFLESASHDHQDVIINGINLGEGFIESFSVDGEFIRTAEYKISLTIYEEKNLSDIEFSGGGNDLEFDESKQSLVRKEDLRYLSSFDESMNFSEDNNSQMSINHSVSCLFLESKSIISKDIAQWANGQKQNNKLANLGNRAKASLKVQADGSAQWENSNLSKSSLDVGEDYILSFDFLGIDESPSIKTESKAVIDLGSGSEVQKDFSRRGHHKIEFTTSSSSITIKLFSPAGKNAFYKNIKLFKKSDTSIERSRTISTLFMNSNPVYGLMAGDHSGIYQYSSNWENQETEENFNESNLSYQRTRSISYARLINKMEGSFITPTPGMDKDHSVKRNTSLNMDVSGEITIEESCFVKILQNKSDSNLDKVIENLLGGTRSRCAEKYSSYSSSFEYGCEGVEKTPISTASLSINPISKRIVRNSFDCSAEISFAFSDHPKQESENYFHEEKYQISHSGGNFTISQEGNITGGGDVISQRYLNAKNAFTNDIEPNIVSNINDVKFNVIALDPNTKTTFYQKEKSINLSMHAGAINYSYVYSNEDGQEEMSNGIIKSFEIEVSESKVLQKFNDFKIGCINVAQLLGDLVVPVERKISISSVGFAGKSISLILEKTKEKLEEKGLMHGVNSALVSVPSGTEVFLTEESFSFSNSSNSLKYNRAVLDLSECENAPRPTVTPGFGLHLSSIDSQFTYFPTPTPNYDFDSGIPYTPIPQTPTPLEREFYITPTITVTPTTSPSVTSTLTPV
jgi:hypothetical protein